MSATRGEPVTCAFIEGGTGPGTHERRLILARHLNQSENRRTA